MTGSISMMTPEQLQVSDGWIQFDTYLYYNKNLGTWLRHKCCDGSRYFGHVVSLHPQGPDRHLGIARHRYAVDLFTHSDDVVMRVMVDDVDCFIAVLTFAGPATI